MCQHVIRDSIGLPQVGASAANSDDGLRVQHKTRHPMLGSPITWFFLTYMNLRGELVLKDASGAAPVGKILIIV